MHIDGPCFKDESGRTLLLRGVNLGGSSKVPYTPNGATYIREGFFDHRQVSFVGRPFPLEEADEHFARLRKWGLTFLRFLVTWEAVEHAGPGVYDQEYLDYLHAVVAKAAQHGIRLFIDPHQDMWSRFSGGDGAPGWTFEAVGMDTTRFQPTGAAFLHPVHGDPLPRMIWPTNATKTGRRDLRWALVEAAWVAVETHPHWKGEFEHLTRRMDKNKAIVAIARKLLVVVWHVLTERVADKHAEPKMVAFKLMRWSWQLTPEQRGGLTTRQFVRLGLMQLKLGENLTHLTYGNLPRRIASVDEMLALKPELRRPTNDPSQPASA